MMQADEFLISTNVYGPANYLRHSNVQHITQQGSLRIFRSSILSHSEISTKQFSYYEEEA